MEEQASQTADDFNKVVLEKIILPYARELELHKQLYAYDIPVALVTPANRAEKEAQLHRWIKKQPLNLAVTTSEIRNQDAHLMGHIQICLQLARTSGKKQLPEIRNFFMSLLNMKIRLLLHLLENVTEIQFYLDFTGKVLKTYTEFTPLPPEMREEQLRLIRLKYLILHKAFFEPEKVFYTRCLELIQEELALAESGSHENKLTAYKNYLDITLDHLYFKPGSLGEYINIEEFNQIQTKLVTEIKECLKQNCLPEMEDLTVYTLFSIFYRIRNLNILLKMDNNKGISAQYKKEMLILITELIKIFYGSPADYPLFLYNSRLDSYTASGGPNPFASRLQGQITRDLSAQLSHLLADQSRDVTWLLDSLTHFFRLFREFQKINLNSYRRILLLCKEYQNRRLYLSLSILYLKALYKIDVFRKQTLKLKTEIEKKPFLSLIHYYNKEINTYSTLSPDIKNELRLDTFITQIHQKELEIRRHILLAVESLREKGTLNDQNSTWLEYMRHEFENNFILARNMDLIKDLGQLYCFFIDSYIKNERMEYREDFIQKATALKMQILDINPYYFIIALLYAKVGKLRLFHTEDATLAYCARKTRLTDGEKEKMAAFIPLSVNMLPRQEEGIHWRAVEEAIMHMRDPAVGSGQVAPPESRVLKVLSAIINKITRQDIAGEKLFPALYEEAFVPAKNAWDLDPVILFYMNKFFKSKSNLYFLSEARGEKIELRLNVYMNHQINEKIGKFLKSLIENAPATDLDVTSQMEELSRLNEISLLDEEGNLKRLTLNQVKELVREEKAVYYESGYLEFNVIQYLTKLLENYFVAIAKQSYTTGFKFILNELIRNANDTNLKVAHFQFNKLDMGIRYDLGIKTFSEKRITNFADYKKIIRQEDLKVKVSFHVFKNNLLISVSNNYKLHQKETDIIHARISSAGGIKNVKEAVLHSPDDENSSSNIVVMLLLLRKYGLYQDFFKLNLKENETLFRVTLPLSLVSEVQREIIAEELAKEIERIPMLRSNIQELRRAIYNPDSTIEQIEKLMRTDASLVIDVLKFANSAFVMAGQEINSIREAIKILGLKQLHNMVLVSHSYRLLEGKVSEQRLEKLIKHCQLTAFLTREIILRKRISQVDEDNVFLAALLHDIGILVIEGLEPEVYMEIQEVLQNREIPLEVIENLAGGINHALVGYKLAEKWKFSKFLQEAIRYHHTPSEAPTYMNEIFIIYLANTYTHYNEGRLLFENIDQNVLVYFDLNNKDEFAEFGSALKKAALNLE